jgi:hypothetical protein
MNSFIPFFWLDPFLFFVLSPLLTQLKIVKCNNLTTDRLMNDDLTLSTRVPQLGSKTLFCEEG